MDPLGVMALSGGAPVAQETCPDRKELSGDGSAGGHAQLAAGGARASQPAQAQQHVIAHQQNSQQAPQSQQHVYKSPLQQQHQQQVQVAAGPAAPASSLLAAAKAAAAAAAAAATSAASTAAAVASQLPSLPTIATARAVAAMGASPGAHAAASPTAAAAASPPAAALQQRPSGEAVQQQQSHQQQQQQAQQQQLSPAARTQRFHELLATEPCVDMRALRTLAMGGVPDEPDSRGLRAAVWRLLLGLLPPERAQWERALRRKRAEYAQFCEELIVDPKQLSTAAGMEAAPGSRPNPLLSHGSRTATEGDEQGADSSCGASGVTAAAAGASPTAAAAAQAAAAAELERLALGSDDHPLSNSSGSKWKAYFQDVEVQEQIERDVARTHPDMHFFSGDTGAAAEHRAQMRRALFIFAKLNPGLRYVQGMNELYAPLYFLFRTDPEADAAAHAEADAFFCFVDLMGEFRDHFCQQLDNSTVGIRATLGRLSQRVRCHDEELWAHLERGVRVNPQFYAFRWITLALTQEFAFPDALRLWDTLLADPAGRTDCLLRLCTAMLLHARGELLQGDFAACMKLLQRYPPVDVNVILAKAEALKHTKTVIALAD